jgi:hypothetical protein
MLIWRVLRIHKHSDRQRYFDQACHFPAPASQRN